MVDDLTQFESQFSDFDPVEATEGDINVRDLSLEELCSVVYDVNRKLSAARQSLRPTEQWARDAHSLREAARAEQWARDAHSLREAARVEIQRRGVQ